MVKKKQQKKKTGRPTTYTEAIADTVCARLADGESMRKIALDETMPGSSTMFRWLREKKEFRQQYDIAKAECADMYAEEIIEIADDTANDYSEADKDGNSRVNTENIQRSRLKVDARKWVASKLKPKKYGDKIQQEITSPEGVIFNMDFGGKKNGS